jgi:hypothetical protein
MTSTNQKFAEKRRLNQRDGIDLPYLHYFPNVSDLGWELRATSESYCLMLSTNQYVILKELRPFTVMEVGSVDS